MGEELYYAGGSETFATGDKLEYGVKGVVVGPATGKEKDTHLAMQFPGNKGAIECHLTSLSRT